MSMVFLALTPGGLSEALLVAGGVHPVWCCATAISESEFVAKRLTNLTRFAYSLVVSDAALMADALGTIEEHHPGARVWVEHAPAV